MMIADWDKEKGTMDIVFFILGTSTSKLASLTEGESVINKACPQGSLRKLRCSSALAAALESAPFCRSPKLSKRKAIML